MHLGLTRNSDDCEYSSLEAKEGELDTIKGGQVWKGHLREERGERVEILFIFFLLSHVVHLGHCLRHLVGDLMWVKFKLFLFLLS